LGFDLGVNSVLPLSSNFLETVYPELSGTPQQAPPGGAYCPNAVDTVISRQLWVSCFAAAVFGALAGSYLASRFGRRRCLLLHPAAYVIGCILSALAVNPAVFYTGRVIMGLGVGLSCQATPLYLCEIADAKRRGVVGISFQLFVTIGIAVSTFLFYFVEFLHPTAGSYYGMDVSWRVSLLGGAAVGLVVMYCALIIPETPHFLVSRGDAQSMEDAFIVLTALRPVDQDITSEYSQILEDCGPCDGLSCWRELLSSRRHLPVTLLTVIMTAGSQFTFINGFLILLPSLLKNLNISRISMATAVINTSVNMLYTVIAMFASDRFGRRALFLAGGPVMALSSAFTFVLTQSKVVHFDTGDDAVPAVTTVLLIMLYISAFAWSWGPLPWTIPAELSHWKVRSAVTAVGAVSISVSGIAAYALFPLLICALQNYIYLAACGAVTLLTVLMYLVLPETAWVPLHDTSLLLNTHPLWSRLDPLEVHRTASTGATGAANAVPAKKLLRSSGVATNTNSEGPSRVSC
jgi:sugar porter (SP) family MFS transporter